MAERMAKVALSGTLRYGVPRKSYGPGPSVSVPVGLAKSIGAPYEESPEVSETEGAGGATEEDEGNPEDLTALGLTENQAAKVREAGYVTRADLEAASDLDLDAAGLSGAAIGRLRAALKG